MNNYFLRKSDDLIFHGNYIDVYQDKDENLLMVLNDDGKEEIENYIEENPRNITNDDLLANLIEDLLGNGYTWINPEITWVGLTDCNLILTDCVRYNEEKDEEFFLEGDYIWYDCDYAVRSQIERLYKNGYITLKKHVF